MTSDPTAGTRRVVEPAIYREVLGHYPTGVVLVTTISATGDPVGMLVGTFTSVSIDPPLIAYLPRKSSETFTRLRRAPSFCVNVLAANQLDLCRTFAGKGEGKFRGVDWRLSSAGSPVPAGVIASIDCRTQSITEVGDHVFVLGAVTDLEVHSSATPLLFLRGGYGTFAAAEPVRS